MATNIKHIPKVSDELEAMDRKIEGLELLRQPFPAHQISKLPKETKKQIEERKNGQNIEWKCAVCGGMHHKNAVHLDYVGHAALTDRLLDADPNWSWEPMGTTPEGLPAINGGLWIKLTVCGVSRYGFGSADGKTGGDAVKEMIGDALRNAAMRFGAALELWHKGDLHVPEDATDTSSGSDTIDEKQWNDLMELSQKAGVSAQRICGFFQIADLTQLPSDKFKQAQDMLNNTIAKAKKETVDA